MGKDGRKHVVLFDYHGNPKGEVPNQPRHLWPKPKGVR